MLNHHSHIQLMFNLLGIVYFPLSWFLMWHFSWLTTFGSVFASIDNVFSFVQHISPVNSAFFSSFLKSHCGGFNTSPICCRSQHELNSGRNYETFTPKRPPHCQPCVVNLNQKPKMWGHVGGAIQKMAWDRQWCHNIIRLYFWSLWNLKIHHLVPGVRLHASLSPS